MAVQSRSRASRNSDSSSTTARSTKHASIPADADRPLRQPTSILHDNATSGAPDDEPPAKRRKLSIRSKQTTLANYAITQSAASLKPPTRVTLSQPHGRLLQNLNGVQTVLDANEDELSLPPSGVTTPKPKRVPKVAAQPTPEPTKQDDKRTLRSQDDGPRLKSELSIYFPNYEDIIFDAPKEPEFITVDSTLYVTDDPAKTKPELTSPPKGGKNAKASPSHTRKTSANGVPPPVSPQRSSSNQFNGSPSLSLEMIARSLPKHPEDPLTDEHFLKSHRRAERKEKQLRNIEKERAMHEKVQLDRILEGLQGHDWLKVLGITGITDGEAKKFEVKRDYFITEVKTLVDKFKQWKEQERRQKVEKGTPVPVKEEEEDAVAGAEEESDELDSGASSVGPPSSDLNASAARQLQQETAIALKSLAASKSSAKGKEAASATPNNKSLATPMPPPPPEVPITSFYDKQHLRDAALGKARHGRNVTAFGHPVPDMEVMEFALPDEYATEDAIRANAREKRRRKRESVTNASG